MLAQIADLRLCALMSLRPYVLEPLCPFALMSAPLCPAPFCLRPYIGFRVQIIVVFLCSQRATGFNPRAISLFNPSLIHFGSDLPLVLYSGADAVCQ